MNSYKKVCITRYEVVVLLETWLPMDFQINVPGYYSYSIYRPKNPKARRSDYYGQAAVKERYQIPSKFK